MPDPNEPIVNQNTNPINPVKPNWTEIGNIMSDVNRTENILKPEGGESRGSTLSEYQQSQETKQLLAQATQKVKEQDVDTWWETATGPTLNLVSAIASGALDIISSLPSMFEFGHNLSTGNIAPTVLGKLAGVDVKNTQGILNPLQELYDGMDYIVGREGEAGDVFSRTADQIEDYSNANFQMRNSEAWNNMDNGWTEYLVNNTAKTVGGLVPFIVEGYLTGGAATAAKMPYWLSKLSVAHALTSTTGHMLANEVYDRTYNDIMGNLSPEYNDKINDVYDNAYAQALQETGSTQSAEYAATRAKREAARQFGKENPDMYKVADMNAKKGAIVATNINYIPSMLLNLATAGLFTRGHYLSRELLKSGSKWSGKEIATEMGQEVVEEVLIEGLAGDIGHKAGMGKSINILNKDAYGFSDAIDNFFGYEEINGEQKWKGWQTFETAFWAAAGSAGVTGYMQSRDGGPQERWDGMTKKERYEQQQEMIKKHNEIGGLPGNMTLIDTLTTLNKSNKEVEELKLHQSTLAEAGKEKEAKAIGDRILAVQAMNAFKSGTTASLIDGYKKISESDTVTPDVKVRAKEAIGQILDLEKVFQESLTKYGNSSEVFSNRANNYALERLKKEIDTQANTKKGIAKTALDSAFRNKDVSLDTTEQYFIENTETQEQNILTAQERDVTLEHNLDDLLTNPYDKKDGDSNDKKKAGVYEEFTKKASDIKDVRELIELQQESKEIQALIDKNNSTLNKITTPAYQRSLKHQNKLINNIQKDSDLAELKGTDEYIPAIEKHLAKFKGKILPEHADKILENFKILNLLEKVKVKEKKDKEIKESVKGKPEEKPKPQGPTPQKPTGNSDLLESTAKAEATGKPLSKEQEDFKRANSAEVLKRVNELRKGKTPTPPVTDEKTELTNQLLSLLSDGGTVKPLSLTEVNKLFSFLSKETQQKVLTIIRGIKGSSAPVNPNIIAKMIGKANADALLKSLVSDGILTVENDQYVKTESKSPFSEGLLKLINSKAWKNDGGAISRFIIQLDNSKQTPELIEKINAIVDELQKHIANGTITNMSVSFMKENDTYDQSTIILTRKTIESLSPYEMFDESFSPMEEKELSEEVKEKATDVVMDYVNKMMSEDDDMPDFEKFMRDFIFNNKDGAEGARRAFSLLKAGWRGNKQFPQLTDKQFNAIYDNFFSKSKQAIADDLLSLIDEGTNAENTSTKDNSVIEESVKEKVESKKVELTDSGSIKHVSAPATTTKAESTFGYNSRSATPITSTYEIDGEEVTETEYEYTSDELNEGNLTKPLKLLHPDKYLPGTELEVVIPSGATLSNLQMPVYDEDGNVTYDEKGNRITEKWSEFVSRKLKEDPDFLNSQEYEDSIPMLIKDEDGDYVAFVHDVMWYANKTGSQKQAVANIRKIRRGAIEAKKSNESYKIVITKKESGTFSPMKLKEFIPLSDANPQSFVGVVDASGRIIMEGKAFTGKIENAHVLEGESSLRFKYKLVDVRRWGTDENGNPTYMIFGLKPNPNTLTKQQSDTLFHAVMVYILSKSHAKGTKYNKQYEGIAKQISALTGLELRMDDSDLIEKILSQIVFLGGVEKFNKTSDVEADAKKIHDLKLKSSKDGKVLPYIYLQNRAVVFYYPGLEGPIVIAPDTFKNEHNSPEMNAKVAALKEFFNHEELGFNPTFKEPIPVITIDEVDGKLVVSTADESYTDYVKQHVSSNVGSHNVGTQDEPMHITKVQPLIYFEKSEGQPVSRKTTSETVKEAKPIVKQKATYISDVITDDELLSVMGEAEDFKFIGETEEEQLEDAKEVLAEGTNETEELLEKLEISVDKITENDPIEIARLIKLAEAQAKWVNGYIAENVTDLSAESLSPAEMSDESAKKLIANIFKIEGLSSAHQQELVEFLFNQVSGTFKLDTAATLNKKELVDKLKKELARKMSDNKQMLSETLEKLKLVPGYEQNPTISKLVLKYEVALAKFDVVDNNVDTLVDDALNKLYKSAGIKVKVEKNAETDSKIKAEESKQEALENKVKELEDKIRALRSEDGSVPDDKLAEFRKLRQEVLDAKAATNRGNSKESILIKQWPKGANTATTNPEILSADEKNKAADAIEDIIKNSKSTTEVIDKIDNLGYLFDLVDRALFVRYLNDRFNPNAPKIGNNKDSFQSWVNGKSDVENDSNEEIITIEYNDSTDIDEQSEEETEDTFIEDDSMSERDDNYSQTSLEKDNKKSINSELRMFLSGMTNTNSKTGQPILGAFGVDTYVDFDTVFNTLQAFLSDKPVDFDLQMQILEDLYTTTHPWITQVVEKLRGADKQIQNAFANKMGTHSLKMEFAMYSFDLKTGAYTLRVTDTNQGAIVKKIVNNWNNNLFAADNPLVMEEDGEYVIDTSVAKELLKEYDGWFDNAKPMGENMKKLVYKAIIAAVKSGKSSVTLNEKRDADLLKETNLNQLKEEKAIKVDGVEYSVKHVNGKLVIKPFKRSIVSQALYSGYKSMSKEKQAEAIGEVQRWLSYFGIELADGAIDEIFTKGIFIDGKYAKAATFFGMSNNTPGAIGTLAQWCKNITEGVFEGNITDEENKSNNPLDDKSIRSSLAYLQSKYSKSIVTNSFRDGKKNIYGFTAFKYITDRFNELKEAGNKTVEEREKITEDIFTQLKSLPFSQQSMWLSFMDATEGYDLGSKFGISHLGLTAFLEKGKKVYKDNSITALSDTDHEATQLTLFQDVQQGSTTHTVTSGSKTVKIPLRVARFFFPTMSDKTTMVVIKAPVLDLTNPNLYSVKDGKIVIHGDVISMVYEQAVLPEIMRMFNHKENVKKTNIKGYDEGAGMMFFLPKLNDLEITLNTGTKVKLQDFINNEDTKLSDLTQYMDQIYPAIESFIDASVNSKLDNWKEGGIIDDDKLKFVNDAYLKKIKKGKAKDSNIPDYVTAAFDYEINSIIANANMFMTMVGDPALYYKADPTKTAIEQSTETFVNVGKRLAAMIAPGSKINKSENEQYIQVFLEDSHRVANNIKFLTKLLDKTEFDDEEYMDIVNMPDKSSTDDKLETEKLKADKKAAMKDFFKKYPKSADYLKIESTDAQEYTTWKEHLHILENMGRIADSAFSITPEEIREAKEMFANNVPIESMTDAQKAVLKKVLQPIKPVYTGQIYDPEQGVMRMMYIKTSSYPLIPQLTEGLELNTVKETLEAVEKKTGKHVRASYQSGNKVGAVKSGLKVFNPDGTAISHKKMNPKTRALEIDVDGVMESALVLNRKDFKIQLDVPFKSFKKKEDTVSMGTQLTKLLFGNGMMEETGFKLNGKPYTGKQLQEHFTDLFKQLIDVKKKQLFDELGLDPITLEPIDIKTTALKLQEILVEEALDKGYSNQDLEGLALNFIKDADGNITDYKFEMPIWMTPNAFKFESLLNSIINSRIVKMKFPGNSYVAGSEAGYKFKNDFEGIDENKIVWTDKWQGELQGAKYDDKGNLMLTQVILPSKFKTADGKLINMLEKDASDKTGKTYKYVDETSSGFRLKKGKIADELLTITSFRTPTSGHVSGLELEIVGFLPEECGDLMILPANVTKQKGLDFDIDKETAYHLWATTLDTGTVIPLHKDHKGVKKLEEKLIQNEILRVHKAVFSNPSESVQQKINGILSINFAKSQAEKIDNVIEGEKDSSNFSPLTSQYQKFKMGLGASGKIGTGAYSLDVTSHSLFEQAKSTGKQLVLLEDENVPLKITIGKVTSDGKLGESKALKVSKHDFVIGKLRQLDTEESNNIAALMVATPEQMVVFEGQATINSDYQSILDEYEDVRSIAEMLIELQNIAVDNEKEQVMGKVNLNGITLDVSKALTMLGFDKGETGDSIQFLLLSQPILRDYVNFMGIESSNLSEYNPDKEAVVLKKLADKYGFDDATKITGGEMLTTGAMWGELTSPTPMFQKQALETFLLLKGYGGSIRSIQTAINTDSKGLGKSLPEVSEKIESIKNVFTSKIIANAGAIIGERLSRNEVLTDELKKEGYIDLGDGIIVKPTTVAGIISLNGLTVAKKLWGKHFPYNKPTIEYLNDELMGIMNLSEASESKKVEKKQLILKEVKKFLNTFAAHGNIFENNTAQEERNRLFFDSKVDNKLSLASYIQKLMKLPYFANNRFLQTFEYEISTVPGKPSIIKFNNAAAGNFDESYLNNALLQLMEANIALPSFNGETYNTRMLAQDIVTYSLLEGGVQEVIQFSKFIPLSYLKEMGFIDQLNKINFDRGKGGIFGLTGESDISDENYRPSVFAIQFAQHNAASLPKIDNIIKGLDEAAKAKMAKTETLKISDFKTKALFYPPFIALRINSDYVVWMKDGNTYKKISTLGILGMSEYDPYLGGPVKSLIKSRKKFINKPKTNPTKPTTQQISQATKTVNKERYGLGIDTIQEVIKNMIADKTVSKDLIKLAQAILPFVKSDVKIIVANEGEQVSKAKYNFRTNTITMSAETAQEHKNELIRVFLKEAVHSITDGELLKYVDRDGVLTTKQQLPQHVSNLLTIYRAAKSGLEKKYGADGIQKVIDKIKQQKNAKTKEEIDAAKEKAALTGTEARVLYGVTDLLEFVEMMMTEPEFQKEMSEISYGSGTKNLRDKFFQFLKQMFDALGINVDGESITANAIEEIFKVMTDAKPKEPTNKGFKLSVDKKGKDQGKADLANAFISYPQKGTSSFVYMGDAENQGIPINNDIPLGKGVVAFVSVNGNGKATPKQLDATYFRALAVLKAGGTIVMDSTDDADRTWNATGEALVQKRLGKPSGQTSKGYNYWGPNPETISTPTMSAIDNSKVHDTSKFKIELNSTTNMYELIDDKGEVLREYESMNLAKVRLAEAIKHFDALNAKANTVQTKEITYTLNAKDMVNEINEKLVDFSSFTVPNTIMVNKEDFSEYPLLTNYLENSGNELFEEEFTFINNDPATFEKLLEEFKATDFMSLSDAISAYVPPVIIIPKPLELETKKDVDEEIQEEMNEIDELTELDFDSLSPMEEDWTKKTNDCGI